MPITNSPEKFQIKVAISSDFFTALNKLPKAQYFKTIRLIESFKKNPISPGANYEKIADALDPDIHSLRVDDAYRCIVHKPRRGDVYLLLWVDRHDEAYAWAANRQCKVNPGNGSIQVYSVEEKTLPAPVPQDQEKDKERLFSAFRDRQLLKFGLPEEYLPLVRTIRTDEELERLDTILPQEAYEALYLLASGYSEEEVYHEQAIKPGAEKIDTEDFQTALENDNTRSRFYVVEDELELQAILNAPLEKWRVFLHPSQRQAVTRDWNGPVRILGGAGTGKTVAAIHRAHWLAVNRFDSPTDRILFTTFTKNLAADIRQNLEKICPVDICKRIDVVNLDKWVVDYLSRQDYNFKIHYWGPDDPYWKYALGQAPTETGLPGSFYREEWEKVIQPLGILSSGEYLKASRLGRGVRLNRKKRLDIWPVFESYRTRLIENNLKEREDAIRDAAQLLETKKNQAPYRAVIVDEAQDMGTQAFQLIARIAPREQKNNIYIVGDPYQKIYKPHTNLSQCGINVRGRSRYLRINYRTTEETRKWAITILQNLKLEDLDGAGYNQKGYRSLLHGSQPRVENFDTFEKEIHWIIDYLKAQNEEERKATCLVLRTRQLRDRYRDRVKENGIPVYLITAKQAEDRSEKGLRLATMHRVKGLEFDNLVIASVNENIVPFELNGMNSEDPTVREEADMLERSLLYVSATRAKKQVIITSYGKPSPYL
jgi:superfamily I DNA/RNA helicase